MAAKTAKIIAVTNEPVSALVSANAAVGATYIETYDTTGFSATGGGLKYGESLIAYSSIDASNTLPRFILRNPLTVAVPRHSVVVPFSDPTGMRALIVAGEDGDGAWAQVPQSLRAFLAEGVREYNERETCTYDFNSFNEIVLVDIIDREIVIDRDNLDIPDLEEAVIELDELLNVTIPQLNTDLADANVILAENSAALVTLNTITLPAMQTTLGGLTSAVGDINADLSTLDSNLAALDGELTTAQGQITTLTSTTIPALNGQLTTLSGNLTTAQGQINTLNNTTIPGLNTSINTLNTVTIPALNTQLQAMNDAGPNLLRNSSYEKDIPTPITANVSTSTYTTPSMINTGRNHRITRTNTGDAYVVPNVYNDILHTAIAGKTITVSFTTRANAAATYNPIQLQQATTGTIIGANVSVPVVAGRRSWTVVVPTAGTGNWRVVRRTGANTNDWNEITGIQVEIGSIATSWSAHPEEAYDEAIAARADINTLSTVTLPALSGEIATERGRINTLNDTTIPALNSSLNTLNNTTIPGLNSQLSTLNGKFPVGSTDISDGAITTPKITVNTLNGDRILVNTLNAGKIVAGSIETDRMTINTINGDRITINTLNASKIVAGSITTDRMTVNTINGDRILVNTLNAAKIVAGSITGDRVMANTLQASKLTLQDTTNLVDDPLISTTTFGSGQPWQLSGFTVVDTTGGPGNAFTSPGNGVQSSVFNNNYFACQPGEEFFVSIKAQNTTNVGHAIRMYWYDKAGVALSPTYTGVKTIPIQSWDTVSGPVVAPAGAYEGRLAFVAFSAATSGDLWITTPMVRRKNGAELVVDGSILTQHITVNTLNGDRILVNTLNASKIVAGSIETDRITINTLNGDRITINTLNASKIVAGSIETDRMTVNTINGDRITINTLNASKIVAGSITTDRITVNTLNGDRITINTLNASKIVAGSITADRLGVNILSAREINIADFTNLLPGSDFENGAGGWTAVTAARTIDTTVFRTGAASMKWTGNSTMTWGSKIPVNPGDEFWFSIWVRKSSDFATGDCKLRIGGATNSLLTSIETTPSLITAADTWQEFTRAWTVPANVYQLTISYPNALTAGSFWVDDIQMRRKNAGNLIVDGAITTDHITINTLEGDRIKINTLNASKIVAGSITTDRMTVNTINGDRILVNTLHANKILANTITTNELSALTIEALNISARDLVADQIAAGTIVATAVSAGALNGQTITGASLTVGQITINPTTGITIPQPNGGQIVFPTNGSEALVQAKLIATELTVKNGGQFYGTTLLSGTIRPTNGVPDPTQPVTITTGQLRYGNQITFNAGVVLGLAAHPNNNADMYLTCEPVSVSSNNTYTNVWQVNRSTGAYSLYAQITGWQWRSIVRIGTRFFAYGQVQSNMHPTNPGRIGEKFICELNPSTMAVIATGFALQNGSSTAPGMNPPPPGADTSWGGFGDATMGTDGTNLIVVYADGINGIRLKRFNQSLVLQGSQVQYDNAFPGIGRTPITAYSENFDLGASRGMASLYGNANFIFDPTTGTRYNDNNFVSSSAVRGMTWDGTRFVYLGVDGYIYQHATNKLTEALFGTYTWYDANPSGVGGVSGRHETARATPVAFSRPPRQWVTLTGAPAPTNTTGVDDANLLRFWVGTSAANPYLLGTQPAIGVNSVAVETIPTSGAAAPTAGNFGELGVTGKIESTKLDAANKPMWSLAGDGVATGVLRPIVRQSAVVLSGGSWANNSTQEGWAFTPTVSRPGATLAHVRYQFNAQANQNINQAVGYILKGYVTGQPTLAREIHYVYLHNQGGVAPNLGACLDGWFRFPEGAEVTFQLYVGVQGGGPPVNVGAGVCDVQFFSG